MTSLVKTFESKSETKKLPAKIRLRMELAKRTPPYIDGKLEHCYCFKRNWDNMILKYDSLSQAQSLLDSMPTSKSLNILPVSVTRKTCLSGLTISLGITRWEQQRG